MIHQGNLRLDAPGRFRDMVTGTLTVAAGIEVEVAGTVGGGLVVERGAQVLVSGIVRGGIADMGGAVRVTGIVSD